MPSPFDLDEFRGLKTIQEMAAYLKLHAKKVGMGAARDAWDTGLGYVIKLGPDANARAQNKNEVRVFKKSKSRLVPEVYDQAEDFKWIAVETVRPITGAELNAAIMSSTDWKASDLDDLHAQIRKSTGPTGCQWLDDLVHLVRTCDLSIKELHKGNWGVDGDGVLVVLDTGK